MLTVINAPNRPVATLSPDSRKSSTVRSYNPSASLGGAAALKSGRLPFRVPA